MGKLVMNASVSVDGFVAAENDDPGPLFEWLVSGDVPLGRQRRTEGVAGVLVDGQWLPAELRMQAPSS